MILDIKDVHKTYAQKEVLHGITLSFTKGVYGLLGANGAGKSTLMNIITDNLNAESGEVLWNGKSIQQLGSFYRSILGYAPQQNGLYEDFRADMFLDYLAVLKEIPKAQRKEEITRVLHSVHLQHHAKAKLGSFSGGMKQRMMVAQALLGKPELIILDEPTAGLDPKERIRIRQLAQALGEHAIVLFATHVVSDIEQIAKEIVILKEGNVVAQGSPEELIATYTKNGNLEDVYLQIFQEAGDNV